MNYTSLLYFPDVHQMIDVTPVSLIDTWSNLSGFDIEGEKKYVVFLLVLKLIRPVGWHRKSNNASCKVETGGAFVLKWIKYGLK